MIRDLHIQGFLLVAGPDEVFEEIAGCGPLNELIEEKGIVGFHTLVSAACYRRCMRY